MGDRDWSDLPKDLLVLAFQRLKIPDLLQSAAVSSSWCSAADEIRRLRFPLPPGAPLLLISGDCGYGKGKGKGKEKDDVAAAKLYSLSEDKTYTVHLPYPPIRFRTCIGSSHGWLITADDNYDLHLLNPITGSQIELPCLSIFDHLMPEFGPRREMKYSVGGLRIYMEDYPKNERPAMLCSFLYQKAVLSSSPSEGNDYTVMLIHDPHGSLSFLRAGDNQWTRLPQDGIFDQYRDCIYFRSCFYALTMPGAVKIWDLNGPSPVSKIVMPVPQQMMEVVKGFSSSDFQYKYLVHSPQGELLQVWREKKDKSFVRVFLMDLDRQMYVEVPRSGGYTLLLGGNHGMCISTKELPGFRKNCVYITDDAWVMNDKIDERCDVSVYNLENGRIEPICPADLQLEWPPPIWVTPSLT
ncbi:probable F-box protein At4g22165 [Typha angustifolia]|uniref:probable F-box protein At4g22165 n=1 Tax=Typha angustifolia TaxID=59011 RepID=UPI003C304ADA